MLREFVFWYEQQFGPKRLHEIAAELPSDLREYIDPEQPFVKLLGASWYPARLTHAILDAVSRGMSDEECRRLAHDANRWIVKRGMSSVYKFALRRLVTPDLYARSIGRLWKQLHTTGEREIRIEAPGRATSIVRDWAGHHPLLCTITIEMMCAVFEQMGEKNVHWERVSCVSQGGAECVTTVTWT